MSTPSIALPLTTTPAQGAEPTVDTPAAEVVAPATGGAPFETCLALCAAFGGRPVSPTSLAAGLPRDGGRLQEDGFERAAERADLRLTRCDAREAAASLREGDHLIVGDEGGYAVVRKVPDGAQLFRPRPGVREAPALLDKRALQPWLAGGAWSVAPDYLARAPGTDIAVQPERYGWLRQAVVRQWRTYMHVGVASLIANLLVMFASFYSMQVYDRVVPNNAFETLWALSVGVALIYVFDLVLRVARAFMLDHAGKRIDFEISSRLFQQVVGLKMSHRPASAGSFANHLNEFESVRDFFTSLTLTAVIDFPFVFIYIAAIAAIGGSVVFVPLLMLPLMIGVALALQGPIDRAVKASMQATAQKHGMLIEVLAGIDAIKLSAAEGVFQGTWERAVKKIALASMHSKLISTIAVSVVGFLQSIAAVALTVWGVYSISEATMTMGALIACSILASRALAPVGQLASLLSRWQQTRQSMATLDGIFKRPVERPAGKSFVVRDTLEASIELQDVSFTYNGSSVPALQKVNLSIRPGERVAVIGRSGSGKSTLAKLISGLYDPAEGAVRVGGIDVRQLDPQQLRRSIAAVPQDPFLFNGTLRENIAHGDDAVGDERVLEAAAAAGVDEFVRAHPMGYDMPVGERGSLLSGGQRQAVVLARALVGDRRVLLLDEPSSSLDFAAEHQLRTRLSLRPAGETLILVTHRMQMLDLVDRVIVLHAGQVLMDGPRDAVLQKLSQPK